MSSISFLYFQEPDFVSAAISGASSPPSVSCVGLRARLDQVVTAVSCSTCVAASHILRLRLLRHFSYHVSPTNLRLTTPAPSAYAAHTTGPVGLQGNPDWSSDTSFLLSYAWYRYPELGQFIHICGRIRYGRGGDHPSGGQ